MRATQTASRRITDEVTSWPGVEAGPGRRGEFAFKVAGKEIGHLHGEHAAHFFFPKERLAASSSTRAGSRRTRSSPTSRARPRGRSETRRTFRT